MFLLVPMMDSDGLNFSVVHVSINIMQHKIYVTYTLGNVTTAGDTTLSVGHSATDALFYASNSHCTHVYIILVLHLDVPSHVSMEDYLHHHHQV